MKYIISFGHALKKSISSFDYYNDIREVSFKFSFKYFVGLAFIATIATTTQLATSIISTTVPQVHSFFSSIKAIYPEDLEIKIENGQMNVNKNQPIIIGNSKEIQEKIPSIPKNFLLIDENGVIDDIKNNDSLMLLNKNNLIIRQNQNLGSLETIELKDIPNTLINKTTLTEGITKLLPFLQLIPYFFILITLVAVFLYYFGLRLLYLIGVTAFLFGFSVLTKKGLGFAKLYQFGIHAMTAPLLVEIIMNLGGISFEHIFWFPILNITIAMVGIMRLSDSSQ